MSDTFRYRRKLFSILMSSRYIYIDTFIRVNIKYHAPAIYQLGCKFQKKFWKNFRLKCIPKNNSDRGENSNDSPLGTLVIKLRLSASNNGFRGIIRLFLLFCLRQPRSCKRSCRIMRKSLGMGVHKCVRIYAPHGLPLFFPLFASQVGTYIYASRIAPAARNL